MSLRRLIYYSAIHRWVVGASGLADLRIHAQRLTVGMRRGADLALVGRRDWHGSESGRRDGERAVDPAVEAGGAGLARRWSRGCCRRFTWKHLVSLLGIDFRAIGWMVMGAGIGIAEGLYRAIAGQASEWADRRVARWLAGRGAVRPDLRSWLRAQRGMSSRATGIRDPRTCASGS